MLNTLFFTFPLIRGVVSRRVRSETKIPINARAHERAINSQRQHVRLRSNKNFALHAQVLPRYFLYVIDADDATAIKGDCSLFRIVRAGPSIFRGRSGGLFIR